MFFGAWIAGASGASQDVGYEGLNDNDFWPLLRLCLNLGEERNGCLGYE